jgi:hypothetical protein
MANLRFQLLAKVLLGSALVMALLGLYMLLAQRNTVVGIVLLVVAVSDVLLAVVFARRASS